MKIGILGSGIAGLSAAWFLGRLGHEVKIFEKQPALGLGSHEFQRISGQNHLEADVPLRLMNRVQWPSLISLFQELKIGIAEVDSSQSFTVLDEPASLHKFDLQNMFSFNPLTMTDRRVRRGTTDMFRFRNAILNRERNKLRHPDLDRRSSTIDLTLGEYLAKGGYSNEFVECLLYPVLTSTVCTCSNRAIANFPLDAIANVLLNLTERGDHKDKKVPLLFRAEHGVRDVASKLSQHVKESEFSANVLSVSQSNEFVTVAFKKADSEEVKTETFDHLVVATQANQVKNFLDGLTSDVDKMLSCFDYEDVTIVVHEDTRLMPRRKTDWRTFNMITDPEQRERGSMCSIWLQRYLRHSETTVPAFQTINPLIALEESRVQLQVKLQRPVLTHASRTGWDLLKKIHQTPQCRIWFTGSYASPGIPIQENGVVASREISDAINAQSKLNDTMIGAQHRGRVN